jgi:transmembrane sensor
MSDARFSELIRGWLDDSLRPKEVSELLAEITKHGGFPELESQLDRALSSGVFVGKTDAARGERIYKGVVQTTRARPRRLFFRYSAAAALIGLLACGYWFVRYIARSHQAGPALVHNDIAPGHVGAVLRLANGQELVLDSAANGRVATQGAVAVVKMNGQLSYTNSTTAKEVLYNTLFTPRGRQYQLVLPDGTHVWLNAASSIRFPTAFSGSRREVEITGEAYLEVVHDARRPFRVKVEGREIEDLGTHFNVNAYEDEPEIKTILEKAEAMNNSADAKEQEVWNIVLRKIK